MQGLCSSRLTPSQLELFHPSSSASTPATARLGSASLKSESNLSPGASGDFPHKQLPSSQASSIKPEHISFLN